VKSLLLLAGTKKGLFILRTTDRDDWDLTGPFQPGREIHHAVYDARNEAIYATSNDAWFGSEIVRSPDLGKSWQTSDRNPAFAEGSDLKVERVWHIEPGRPEQPATLYAGTAPAALFQSMDHGKTWSEISTLTNHPTRPRWNPGAGGLCLHSIVLDLENPERMFVGISSVGVFRSDDSGKSWQLANRGTRAEFMPNKYPEFGQCVHKLLLADGRLYQQNHCGVYRSENAGRDWTEITAGLPSDFGFPLAIHPRQPGTIYVIPLQGAEFRCPPEGQLRVFRSRNGGDSWEGLTKGLPQRPAFGGVLREGMTTDPLEPVGIYFGTNTGKLFASKDEGDTWRTIADDLPPIFSVETALA
jgi:photosystem II stability/assembly factor-like uncharacterized protein